MDNIALDALALSMSERRADPLIDWRPSSEPQDYFIRQFVTGHWAYGHAGNRSGKTEGIAAPFVGLLKGREKLNGYRGAHRDLWRPDIVLPVLEPPVIMVLAGASYKALSIGAIQTLRTLLGPKDDDNYTEEHAGTPDAVSLFRVRHRLARSKDEWSRLYVFPYEGEIPEGPGLDAWWCDEPPPLRFLTALRSRIRAGRMLRRAITATPRERAKWEIVRREFPAALRKVENGRVRVQWSARVNEALSERDRRQLEMDAEGDPLKEAILNGDHVDLTGKCPFDFNALESALREATPGERHGVVQVVEDDETEWRFRRHAKGNVEVWDRSRKGRFVVASDPSSGIKDFDLPDDRQVRNPACINVVRIDPDPMQVARFNGYVTPAELGIMSRSICDYYTNDHEIPLWIPEMDGGWGDAMLQGFGDDYENIWQEVRRSSTSGKAVKRIGWTQTGGRRGLVFGFLQQAILEGWFKINSADSIRNLQDVHFDANNRLDQGDGTGAHAEDAITLGMIAYAMAKPRERIIRPSELRGREAVEAALGIVRNGVENGSPRDRWRGV